MGVVGVPGFIKDFRGAGVEVPARWDCVFDIGARVCPTKEPALVGVFVPVVGRWWTGNNERRRINRLKLRFQLKLDVIFGEGDFSRGRGPSMRDLRAAVALRSSIVFWKESPDILASELR